MVFLALVFAMVLATGGKLCKQWSNDDMVVARQAVEKEELTISAAAAQFSDPTPSNTIVKCIHLLSYYFPDNLLDD